MEDIINYAKNTYNFNVIKQPFGTFMVKTKYFNYETFGPYVELKRKMIYAKLCDDLCEMLKLNSIYNVVLYGYLHIKIKNLDIYMYPNIGHYVICVRDIKKEYKLETQFYDILTDFPEYFKSPDIKIALK